MFRMYSDYCSNYPKAQSLIIQHEQEHTVVSKLLSAFEDRYEVRLIDYLILPVQRV